MSGVPRDRRLSVCGILIVHRWAVVCRRWRTKEREGKIMDVFVLPQ